MQVIPAINAPDFNTAKSLIEKAKEFLPSSGEWIHLDVGDGLFSSIETWGNPEEFQSLQLSNIIKTEVHLMIINPLNFAEHWLRAGVKRLIVHLETISSLDVDSLLNLCSKYGADLMLSINPVAPVEKLDPYLNKVFFFQILSVMPGKAGQVFEGSTLKKIAYLRERQPSVRIEVDGGINLETAKLAKEAGADIIVSASYIYNSNDPKEALTRLAHV